MLKTYNLRYYHTNIINREEESPILQLIRFLVYIEEMYQIEGLITGSEICTPYLGMSI